MYNLDLRFFVPALINVLSLFLPNLQMNLNSLFFSLVILTLFLITSIKLPLSVTTPGRIRVRAGDFSFFLAISLLGSVFLPQNLFWFGYAVIICVSPWHRFLSGLFAGFLFWVWNFLPTIPLLIINCFVQNHQAHETNSPPPRVVAVSDDDIGGN
ncbi:hypothetical protein Vadar_032739 [Vaccinium darrowii]|uniref:Uncharacterized protein n=1 Tax=Vaccinium darrowii TaxID=229202 RepID=A0ACB7YIN7_9ERIC|nr:hypothetical protein Vadar_032739 [Vaccinium darrowii]